MERSKAATGGGVLFDASGASSPTARVASEQSLGPKPVRTWTKNDRWWSGLYNVCTVCWMLFKLLEYLNDLEQLLNVFVIHLMIFMVPLLFWDVGGQTFPRPLHTALPALVSGQRLVPSLGRSSGRSALLVERQGSYAGGVYLGHKHLKKPGMVGNCLGFFGKNCSWVMSMTNQQ